MAHHWPKEFLIYIYMQQLSLWASGAVNYDCIITNSITSLLIRSRRIPNDAHTNHCSANLACASKRIKNSVLNKHFLPSNTSFSDILQRKLTKFGIYTKLHLLPLQNGRIQVCCDGMFFFVFCFLFIGELEVSDIIMTMESKL